MLLLQAVVMAVGIAVGIVVGISIVVVIVLIFALQSWLDEGGGLWTFVLPVILMIAVAYIAIKSGAISPLW